jgi:hypothetical protein
MSEQLAVEDMTFHGLKCKCCNETMTTIDGFCNEHWEQVIFEHFRRYDENGDRYRLHMAAA